jgi:hypothetical protein
LRIINRVVSSLLPPVAVEYTTLIRKGRWCLSTAFVVYIPIVKTEIISFDERKLSSTRGATISIRTSNHDRKQGQPEQRQEQILAENTQR